MVEPAVHLSGYQRRDHEVIDYEQAELGSTGLVFRGPHPADLSPGSYFACVGAAQTLGCFCDEPYPTLLSDELGLPVLNLGYGGAGPEFFAGQERLLPYLNNARFVVLQVMSGRSQSNSLYECGGLEFVTRRSDGKQMGAQRAVSEALLGGPTSLAGVRVPTRVRRYFPARAAQRRVAELVDETRQRYLASCHELLQGITVPVVLLWFSKRSPSYVASYENVAAVFSSFPQLITQDMVADLSKLADAYVECISERGSPQPLFSRFTGEPAVIDPAVDRPDLGGHTWSSNNYYPSPEMHRDAADALIDVCRELVVGGSRPDSTR